MNRNARLLIADGHQFVADACKQMLEPEFEVTGVLADGRALVQAALQLKPHAAILEVTLPGSAVLMLPRNSINIRRQSSFGQWNLIPKKGQQPGAIYRWNFHLVKP